MQAVILCTKEDRISGKGQPKALLPLCGMPLLKRNLYTLRSVGIREVVVVAGTNGTRVRERIGDGQDVGMRISYVENEQAKGKRWGREIRNPEEVEVRALLKTEERLDGAFLVIEDGVLVDGRILEALQQAEGIALGYAGDTEEASSDILRVRVEDGLVREIGEDLEDADGAYVGVSRCDRRIFPALRRCAQEGKRWSDGLSEVIKKEAVRGVDVAQIPDYVPEIRRRVRPYWFRIERKEDIRRCKRQLVRMSQKQTLDILAWYVHRPIENTLVYYLSELPITPNQLSILTSVVAYGVTALFFTGHLLAGSLLTFVVNILDGLDGKQARVKGIATKLGHIEHSFDLLFEQSWYIAFAWAVYDDYSKPGTLLPLGLGFLMLLFDSFARHSSMQFRQVMGVALADYARFDRAFRRFDGRRNIYSLYIFGLGAVAGRPLFALIAMTVHAVVTGVVYVIRACVHLRAADLGSAQHGLRKPNTVFSIQNPECPSSDF